MSNGRTYAEGEDTTTGPRRLTRRRLATVAAGALLGAGVAGPLRSPGLDGDEPARARAAARTDVSVGISVDPVAPGDPRNTNGGLAGLAQSINHVYETLIIRDQHMRPAPGLAATWEMVNSRTLRLHLRKNVKFTNGEPFDAASVKYTLDSILAPRSTSPWKGQIQAVHDVTIVDAMTVDVKTRTPYRPIVRLIANVPILPAKAGQMLGDRLAVTPIGTGPFKSVRYVPGSYWELEANPQYWGPKPKIRGLTWKYITDNGARVSALLAGDVDVMNNVPPDQISRIKAAPGLTVQSVVSSFIIYVGMRVDRPPFTDRRVRQALNYAIDKNAIVEKLLVRLAIAADSPLAPILPYRSPLRQWAYDPDKARALLKEAGYNPGTAQPVVFGTAVGRYINDREVGQAISGYLDAVGFKHRFAAPDWPAYFSEVSRKTGSRYDMFLLGYGPQSMEPDQLLSYGFGGKPNPNSSEYANPQVDALLEQERESFKPDQLRAIFKQVTTLIWNDAPWLWLYYQPLIDANKTALAGYGPRADAYIYLSDAYWKER